MPQHEEWHAFASKWSRVNRGSARALSGVATRERREELETGIGTRGTISQNCKGTVYSGREAFKLQSANKAA